MHCIGLTDVLSDHCSHLNFKWLQWSLNTSINPMQWSPLSLHLAATWHDKTDLLVERNSALWAACGHFYLQLCPGLSPHARVQPPVKQTLCKNYWGSVFFMNWIYTIMTAIAIAMVRKEPFRPKSLHQISSKCPRVQKIHRTASPKMETFKESKNILLSVKGGAALETDSPLFSPNNW